MNLLLRNLKVQLFSRRYGAEQARAEKLLATATEPTDEVIAAIRQFLQSDSWEVRNAAVKTIGRIHCEPLYGVLVEKLCDRNEAGILRRNCAEMVYNLRLASAADALRAALHDGYWEVRAEAARALSAIVEPSPELETELRVMLIKNGNFEARAAAAQALGKLGMTRETFDALAKVSNNDIWLLRYQTTTALVEMAARLPDFAAEASKIIHELDMLADGVRTISVYRQHILDLMRLTDPANKFPSPETLRSRYLHMKTGWLKERRADA